MSMRDASISELVESLKHEDAAVRDRATQELWQRWFTQKGAAGLSTIQAAQDHLDQGRPEQAATVLDQLIADQPDFTEAWNRRAVLRYTQQDYRGAITDCQEVLARIPYHFGALHGLGLCYAALGNYREAIAAFRKALAVQPYATINQRLLLECTARLS